MQPLHKENEAVEPSVSEVLAHSIVELRTSAVPSEVVERTCWTVIDALGVMIYGGHLPQARPVLDLFGSRSGEPAASVFGASRSMPVENAAAANAFLIHIAETDDSDLRSQLRASAVIMSAALSVAEAYDASGADFLKAAALGYTIQQRLATPFGVIQGRGWMTTGVWGPPSAAALASFLLKLDEEKTVSAIALAGSASGGSFQYYYDQTEEKRLIVARASRIAVESAMLASRGEEGPRHIFEGPAGLYRLFGGANGPMPSAADIAGDLGRLEGPLFIYPKFFAASHSIIPTLNGLAKDLPPDFRAEDVDAFIVRAPAAWGRVIGAKINDFSPPPTDIGAMLNYSFVVSKYLVRRSVLPGDYRPEDLADPAVLAFAEKGRYEVAADEPAEISLEFRMKDGRSLFARPRTPGPAEQSPLDADQRLLKFKGLTRLRLSAKAQDELIALCHALPDMPSMADWARRVGKVIG